MKWARGRAGLLWIEWRSNYWQPSLCGESVEIYCGPHMSGFEMGSGLVCKGALTWDSTSSTTEALTCCSTTCCTTLAFTWLATVMCSMTFCTTPAFTRLAAVMPYSSLYQGFRMFWCPLKETARKRTSHAVKYVREVIFSEVIPGLAAIVDLLWACATQWKCSCCIPIPILLHLSHNTCHIH